MAAKPNLSSHIYHSLKNRIIRWGYPPGHRLAEEELCREFGVSRMPVREALHMLEENGLVDKTPHRGCTVKQPDLTEVHELYDVRLALELFVVAQLAQLGTEHAPWQPLQEVWTALMADQQEAEIDGLYLGNQDIRFHETLALATGNRTLYLHVQQVNERLYFTRMTDITSAERLKITCQQHLAILHALHHQDAVAAQHAIRANIEFGRDSVETALKEALARSFAAKPALADISE